MSNTRYLLIKRYEDKIKTSFHVFQTEKEIESYLLEEKIDPKKIYTLSGSILEFPEHNSDYVYLLIKIEPVKFIRTVAKYQWNID